jgi:ribosomal protein S18 acetylase RimI-like enzyme
VIRRAESRDLEQIVDVFERSFATLEFLPKLHTHEENLDFFTSVIEKQDVWVAEQERRVAGFLALERDLGTFLYVDPAVHGSGVGSELWEQATRARPGGFRFWAFERNEKARSFYERRGCRAIDFTCGLGNEEREPDVMYEWLPSGPAAPGSSGQ